MDFSLCRYGKLTFSGVIKDGMSAITRYYLNNFHDGVRQASLSRSMNISGSTELSSISKVYCFILSRMQ